MNFEKKVLSKCSVCGEPIRVAMNTPFNDKPMEFNVICKCGKSEYKEYMENFNIEQERLRIEHLREDSLMDVKARKATLSNFKRTDDNETIYKIVKNYIEKFDVMYERGQGLLLYGTVGTGKTYAAATIANELINRQRTVIMTSFVKLLNSVSPANRSKDILSKLNSASLLVIDDLGAERNTDYASEIVYDILDSRYRVHKPIILTTNLDLKYMKSCQDTKFERLYDRIFEMCYPVKMEGMSWRKNEARDRYYQTKELLEG